MQAPITAKLTRAMTMLLLMGSAHARDTLFDNALMPRMVMRHVLECQEQGLPVSEPIHRYCAQVRGGEIFISEEDKAFIAHELLQHLDMIQTYLHGLYKTWRAVGTMPEQYRALTRAGSCDITSVVTITNDIAALLNACCIGYGTDFSGTWTALAALETDITICCSTQQANFVSTWTIINNISPASPTCGPVTVIHQADIDPINGYTIGISGNYCLGEDIVSSADIIISITASNVFLDIQNHEILCNNTNATAVQISGQVSAIGIKQGTFTDGLDGIAMRDTSNNITIEQCVFQNQTGNCIDGLGADHRIAYCIFRNCAQAIHYAQATDIAIHDCIMTALNSDGIAVAGSTVNIQNCIAAQVDQGFNIQNVSNAAFTNCIVSGAVRTGIVLPSVQTATLQSCLIANNDTGGGDFAGISFSNSSDSTIRECYIYQNQSDGINIAFASNAITIDDSILTGNGYAITLNNATSHNIATAHTLLSNNIYGINNQNDSVVRIYNCALLNNMNASFTSTSHATIENCFINTPLALISIYGIIRNNEAFSCINTMFNSTNDPSTIVYNNNAFNAGNPAYSSVNYVLNVNTPDPLTGTVADVLSNLTNTN